MNDLYPNALDFLAANKRLISIYPFSGKKCSCNNDDCENAGKHPKRPAWQESEIISDTQLGDWIKFYGCNGLGWAIDADCIVIDVDPRNGGDKSLDQLEKDIDINLRDICKSIVRTGGGGVHLYFKKDPLLQLGSKLPSKYPGVDIRKHGNFVVIPGSEHASGDFYEWHSASKSELDDMTPLPSAIADMLTRVAKIYSEAAERAGTTDVDKIDDMLKVLEPNMDYENWVRVGMAIHSATSGSNEGLAVWDKWSQPGSKYKEFECSAKWHSFGRYTGNTINIGTLVKMAESCGWADGPRDLSDEQVAAIKEQWDKTLENRISLPDIAMDADIDIYQPPGLLGRINDYVYACSVFPNKNLALACSLAVLTNAIGRKYYMPGRFASFQPNMIIMCVAGSSVGKDSVLGAAHKLLSLIGVGPSIHGRIKSEKDLLDAMQSNQYAMYFNDEFGYFLQRLSNAMNKGSASYLEGIISTIMEAFTKGDKTFLLDISRKREVKDEWQKIFNTNEKCAADGNTAKEIDIAIRKRDRSKTMLDLMKDGLPNPFLSMFTTATHSTMAFAFTGDSTNNGFLSRAMTFFENETNPLPRPDFQGAPSVPMGLEMALKAVRFDRDECPFGRVDSFNQKQVELSVDVDARVYIDRACSYFLELAEIQKENGLESLPRRAPDTVVKICIALAAEDRRITLPMARYAVKLARVELDRKIRRVSSTEKLGSKSEEDKNSGLAHRILEICDTQSGLTIAAIHNKCKSANITKKSIESVVKMLEDRGDLEALLCERKVNGEDNFRYRSTSKSW